MLNCPTCGYESPDGAKYCRNCGAGLSAGSDPLEAATRNYGGRAGRRRRRLRAAAASIGDAVAGDPPATATLFGGAAAYAPRAGPCPRPTPLPQEEETSFLKWGAFLLALLISGGIGAAINDESNDGRVELSREDRVRLERLRAEDQIRRR